MKKSKILRWTRALRTAGILVAVASFSYWQRDQLTAHPVVTALIAVGAAFLASLLAFERKVRDRLEEKWVDSVADWIDAQVRLYGSLLLTGFRRRYYRQLRYRHRVFNVRGLRTQGVFTLELEKVFVDLQVAPQSLQDLSPKLLRTEAGLGRRSIWELLVSRHTAFRSLAVIGPPGSGKTTLMQHLALVFACNKQRKHERRCRAFVPILLFVRSHADTITGEEPPTLAEIITAFETAEGLKPPAEWFERKLRKGRALVLLDGLDEVADAEKRRRVVHWVANEIERYGEARFIVTSRPHGYKTNPLPAATVLEVQPFTFPQVQRFVESWYLANEVLSFGKEDAGVQQHAQEQSRDLIRRLRNAPSLAALVFNPLLLTMVAMVHRYRGALPGRRVELYGEICDVLLGHWQGAKGLTVALTPAQSRAVLEPLAFQMMKDQVREISVSAAQKAITKPLGDVQGPGANTADFLATVKDESGLLLEREAGIYSFAHLTFQEFFAATHVVHEGEATQLIFNVNSSWWHETIRLYAAQSDATPVIRACLDAQPPKSATLTLAYECLREGKKVSPEIREQLEARLTAGLTSHDIDRWKLATEVLLDIRLRGLQPLSEKLVIDTSFVSCREYQLFLEEKFCAGEQLRPDHWHNTRFAEDEALEPILGIRQSDATAFCHWLSERSRAKGYAFSLRLPTPQEVQQNPIGFTAQHDRFSSLRIQTVGTWTSAAAPQIRGLPANRKREIQDCLRTNIGPIVKSDLESCRALDKDIDRLVAIARDPELMEDVEQPKQSKDDVFRARDLFHRIEKVVSYIQGRFLSFDVDRYCREISMLTQGHTFDLARAGVRGENLELVRTCARELSQLLDRSSFALELNRSKFLLPVLKISAYSPVYREFRRAYLCLLILDLRIKGRLPAWEGIRIVGERVTAES